MEMINLMNKKAQARTFAIVAIIALIVVTLSWVLIINNKTTGRSILANEPIKIGIIGHFSGEYADYGIPMKKAVELAIEEINEAGGIDGRKLVLVVEDDGTDSAKAASGMNKLVNVNNVDYIFSAQGSGATSVITPIANTKKRILMITLGSAPDLTTDKDYVFRSIPSDIYQASEMVDYLNRDLNPNTIAGLYRNDPYGVGIKNIVEKGVSADVVASELYDPTSSDFRTQLTKIKHENPDVLVIAGAKDNYPILLKQIKELGISSTILTSETFYDEEVLEKTGKENVEGIYTLFPEDPIDYVNFEQKYNQMYGEDPSPYSIYAYDGAISIIKSLEGSDNVNQARINLLDLSFNGASGKVGFDIEGDRTGAKYAVYKVRDGEFVKISF
jgi:branched-chain amino acid transport system substrate-binding protein